MWKTFVEIIFGRPTARVRVRASCVKFHMFLIGFSETIGWPRPDEESKTKLFDNFAISRCSRANGCSSKMKDNKTVGY